ncbi:MAG TPA: DUF1559 domain-containing protein [Thermoguttaceae bacterium]|nr:DUF1559 domain-containing protein [Thermoguttaceae bacterium]
MQKTILFSLASAFLIALGGCSGKTGEKDGPSKSPEETAKTPEDAGDSGKSAKTDQGARETAEKPGVEIRTVNRLKRGNNLKQIAIALISYEMQFGRFPAAASPLAPGQPAVSWRVRLLPHLECSDLFQEYRRDEPWDSPNNIKLLEKMPDEFRGGRTENDGKTSLMAFVGEGTALQGAESLDMVDVGDGVCDTIVVVEAGPDKAVPWTKPDDLPFDPADPLAALGEIAEDDFPAAFCDGSVRWIEKNIDPEMLRRLIDANDGLPVDPPEF